MAAEWQQPTAVASIRCPVLLGITIGDDDARYLIAELYRDAHAPAVSAALMIEKGIERDLIPVLSGKLASPRCAATLLPELPNSAASTPGPAGSGAAPQLLAAVE